MIEEDFPSVHFFNQDFIDLYNNVWSKTKNFWQSGTTKNKFVSSYFNDPNATVLSHVDTVYSTFFLCYCNGTYPVAQILDNLYKLQESSGAIRSHYDVTTGKPIFAKNNPDGLCTPLLAWAEYNLYQKAGNKKRLKEITPSLVKYIDWLIDNYRQKNGLFAAPLAITGMENSPRKGAHYLIDFNCQMAINTKYLSEIGDILNEKEIAFKYKRIYYSLKTRINEKMWSAEDGFFFDLDKSEKQVKTFTIASYWTLFSQIPNEANAELMIDKLKDPAYFESPTPFPSLAQCDKSFSEKGNGYQGSVFPYFNFIVIKGLERYQKYEFARDIAQQHLYQILDTLDLDDKNIGKDFFEAYLPTQPGAAKWNGHSDFPRKNFIYTVGLSTITLMIENILGFLISYPKKTVEWILPSMEELGIENFSLKRNKISILSNESGRGWEIRLESEKLYYFTINILDQKKTKTLPIPSGKCSMLIDKLQV